MDIRKGIHSIYTIASIALIAGALSLRYVKNKSLNSNKIKSKK